MSLVSSVSHGFIHGFWQRLQILVVKTKDFGEDYGFFFFIFAKNTSSSPVFTLQTNEGGASTEHVQTY